MANQFKYKYLLILKKIKSTGKKLKFPFSISKYVITILIESLLIN